MLARYAHLATVDDYAAALRAQGLQAPESVDIGRLALSEDRLSPVVPMNAPPGGGPHAKMADVTQLEAELRDVQEKMRAIEGRFRELPDEALRNARVLAELIEVDPEVAAALQRVEKRMRAAAGANR